MYKVITISREFGSGGRTIGKRLAEKLNYKFYDSELVKKVANESGYDKDFIEKHGEYASSTSRLMFSMSRNVGAINSYNSVYDEIYIAQQKVIEDLANEGNVVIVGRCADYILRNRDDVLNVFIYAPIESRKKRIIEEYKEVEGKPIDKRIKECDQKRKTYYKTYTGQEFGDVHNYDLSINSSLFTIDGSVELIYRVVKEK